MTKPEFLARCANAWDVGLCTPGQLRLMSSWLDFVMRLEGGQMSYVADFLEQEAERTDRFHTRILANDQEGYNLQRLAAILVHPCQRCAVDRDAWWTRPAFCEHREEAPE